MDLQDQNPSKVFAEMTENPITIQEIPKELNLSKNVIKNSLERPLYKSVDEMIHPDFDFLESCGAEEIVETQSPIQESQKMKVGVSCDGNINGDTTMRLSGPVQSVRQKFKKQVKTPPCTLTEKDIGKHLAPRENVPQCIDQTDTTRNYDIGQGPVCRVGEKTFKQELTVAAKMKDIGIHIRPGTSNGSLGNVHIRGTDSLPKQEKMEPVDKFKSNEVVYGTSNAMDDLVRYHDDQMFSTGVTGVYTDKNYRILGWCYRTPQEYSNVRPTQILGSGSFGSVELWQGPNLKCFVKKKNESRQQEEGENFRIYMGHISCHGHVIMHIRCTDSLPKQEKMEPVDKFKSNEVVYGTSNAMDDLVRYHDDQMFSTGVTGVYTDKNYRILGWCYRTPQEYSNVRPTQILGSGSFGSVELWQGPNLKCFVKKKIHQDNFCKNEVLLTSRLQHPNILKMYGFIINKDYRAIIMEYAGESLLSYSMREERSEKNIWDIMYYALEGLKYLHDNHIIHFDIKPENLCIKERPDGLEVTITDFGSAQKLGSHPKSMTYEYCAPELCKDYIKKCLPDKKNFDSEMDEQRITEKVDIFALGLTMMFPYQKSHVMIKKFTGGMDNYAGVERPELIRLQITLTMAKKPNLVQELIPVNVGQNMRDIIQGLTKGDPRERLDANQAIQLMRDISFKAESLRQIENLNVNKDVQKNLIRKVKPARRRSSGETTTSNSQALEKKEKCQGIDMSLIAQEPNAILGENTQLKHRVVKGLMKRKLCEKLPPTGKQMRPNTNTENQNLEMFPIVEEKPVEIQKASNLPNLDMLFD